MTARQRTARPSPSLDLAFAVPWLCAILGGLPACGPSPQQQEARRVVALIDRVRTASPEQRSPHLEALERLKVQGDPAEAARSRCSQTYRALLDANLLESKARRQLAFPSPPLSALGDLATAEKKIEEATTAMPRCNEALAALRRLARR